MRDERWLWYSAMLQQRDQALLVIGAAVLVALLWWFLLSRWPRVRRWLSWLVVVAHFALMLAALVVPAPGGMP